MKFDPQQRYDFSNDFFALEGSVVMKLSADAAIEVCKRASQHGLVIARVEGGFGTFLVLKQGLIAFGMELSCRLILVRQRKTIWQPPNLSVQRDRYTTSL